MNKNSNDLLTLSPRQIMIKLSVPAIIGMVVIGLYPLMDGIFAGQIIGQEAMTAAGIAMPFTYVNNGVATLIGVGSASVLSRALGEGNKETLDKIMGNLLFWVILLSTIITVGGVLFCESLLKFVGASGVILDYGTRYLRIIFLGSFFVNFTQSANMVMRGEGLMKRAMLIMGTGALINIILDPILMIAMGDRAIEGAAIATVTAQIIQAMLTLNYFKNKSETIKIGKIRLENTIYRSVFTIGFSAMLMQVLTIVQQSLLYSQAFKYGGDDGGTIMAAALRVISFSFIPLWGMSQGLQPAIGANYGAKKYDRVKEIFKSFAIGSTLLAAIFYIPSQLFTGQLLGLFGLKGDIISYGIPSFRMFYSVYILYGIMIMCITFFQAIGDGKTAGAMVILRQVILFIPAIIIVPRIFGERALWFTMPAVEFLVVIFGLVKYTKAVKEFRL
ncbi:MAG: MATE family efflux transporter [Epulopiscium sp.]|nr:MATE family efflux transporter [Candidatus Epulonipiscium sp.]